ncbi:hypothetical protein [Bradyrhizobium sp. 162]|uniref:hypothetical protein n=1 Tax=Bradyrhizobium sp. 162 TaxID=2782635 RepID=UPI001FF864C8|nr:hypothetical protein [Bradyrhizobium sp. 162]MCK1635914.1 hypothetical protein [Bradyrhizobium sp. 162]
MASKTKAANAAAAIANGVASTMLTIPEFCHDAKISEGHFGLVRKAKLGPKEIRLGRAVRITVEATAEWRVLFSQQSTQDAFNKFLQERKEQRSRRKQQQEQAQ